MAEAMTEVSSGFIKPATGLGRRAPIHTLQWSTEAAKDDEDIYRVSTSKDVRDKAGEKGLRFAESHFKAILPLASEALWALEAATKSVQEIPGQQDCASILLRATTAIRKAGEVATTGMGGVLIARRRAALQQSGLPSDLQASITRLHPQEQLLLGGKVKTVLADHKEAIEYDREVRRVRPDTRPTKGRSYTSSRLTKAEEKQKAFRPRQTRKRPASATVSRPAAKSTK